MGKRDLLIEAIRRFDMHHSTKNPLDAWTGLGFLTYYNPVLDAGLMTWVEKPAPRCMGWLRLTEKGLDEVNLIRAEFDGPIVFDNEGNIVYDNWKIFNEPHTKEA